MRAAARSPRHPHQHQLGADGQCRALRVHRRCRQAVWSVGPRHVLARHGHKHDHGFGGERGALGVAVYRVGAANVLTNVYGSESP